MKILKLCRAQHWLNQMQQHTEPGMLRIAVLSGRGSWKAHQLAWDHDLVSSELLLLGLVWHRLRVEILGSISGFFFFFPNSPSERV